MTHRWPLSLATAIMLLKLPIALDAECLWPHPRNDSREEYERVAGWWQTIDPAGIDDLVQAGAPVQGCDELFFTPLMECIRQSDRPANVEALIAAGADVTVVAGSGPMATTALTWACLGGRQYRTVELLVEAGAPLDVGEGTPILHAAAQGATDPRVIQLLVANGVPINPQYYPRGVVSMALARHDSATTIEIVSELLESGAPLSTPNDLPPILQATTRVWLSGAAQPTMPKDVLRFLASCGADPNAPEPASDRRVGMSPLDYVIMWGSMNPHLAIDIATVLIDIGADPEFVGPDGRSAIDRIDATTPPDLVETLRSAL